jgi:malonyl-CoA/methylmalonyl-CoA synthetase
MKFDATQVYNALFNDQIVNQGGDFTLFMAVPTIYVKLIAHHKEKFGDALIVSKKNERFRLMVSGSAALPEPTFYAWRNITGHTLLERYGMTEIGMALSNPLHPVEKRIPGTVGTPLPFVSVKLDDPQFVDGVNQGELLVSGPTVFHEYWNKPEATAKTFKGEWFVTGDLASIDQDGVYRILGRLNADIIKTGGYKVSALDIEHVMMSHPSIAECAVLGVPDKEWGERVAALVVLNKEKTLALDELKEFLSEKLAKYKLPTILKFVKEIPRNQMGKVSKKQLVRDFENL